MKFGIVVLVVLVVCLSPSVHGAENDVVRVFDPNLRMTKEEMQEYLKQADLERYGFMKTVEKTTTTDENGKVTVKKTIYYKVTDHCSRVMFWESVLEQRMPKKLPGSKIFSTVGKEVRSRIDGRKTKRCTVGLEIHPREGFKKIVDSGMSKRGAADAMAHWWCAYSSIQYRD